MLCKYYVCTMGFWWHMSMLIRWCYYSQGIFFSFSKEKDGDFLLQTTFCSHSLNKKIPHGGPMIAVPNMTLRTYWLAERPIEVEIWKSGGGGEIERGVESNLEGGVVCSSEPLFYILDGVKQGVPPCTITLGLYVPIWQQSLSSTSLLGFTHLL